MKYMNKKQAATYNKVEGILQLVASDDLGVDTKDIVPSDLNRFYVVKEAKIVAITGSVSYLKEGRYEYKRYNISWDPDNEEYVYEVVFYTTNGIIHHTGVKELVKY